MAPGPLAFSTRLSEANQPLLDHTAPDHGPLVSAASTASPAAPDCSGGPCRCDNRCCVSGAVVVGLAAVLLVVAPLQATVPVTDTWVHQCNNSLDFGSHMGWGEPLGPTCAELVAKGMYSCEADFCFNCALGPSDGQPGLCDRECALPPLCDQLPEPQLRVCIHRALGTTETMVILLYLFASVSFMFTYV